MSATNNIRDRLNAELRKIFGKDAVVWTRPESVWTWRAIVSSPRFDGVTMAQRFNAIGPTEEEALRKLAKQFCVDVDAAVERVDEPGVEVINHKGQKLELVKLDDIELEVFPDAPIQLGIAIISKGRGWVLVPREKLQRLLPALTRYAATGSMVAEATTDDDGGAS